VHNWSWKDVDITLPVAATLLVGGGPLRAGESLALGPWDVTVLVSS
jgi:hypothetical protein